MLRIMHVVDLPKPNPWLNGVATYHDRARFCHMVVSLGPRNELHTELEDLGSRTFALDAASRRHFPAAICKLARLLRRERVDVVQTHLFEPTTVGLLAAKAAGTPVRVATRHHSDFTTVFRKPIHRCIDRWHTLAADKVMAASEAVKRAMVRYEGVPEEKIIVARYGYDFRTLRPHLTPDERFGLRESLGGDRGFLIGTVARLSIEKGHVYLLSAVPEVVRRCPDVRFVLVGTGPLRENLERMVDRLGIRRHVLFLGWRADSWDLMEAMDLVVHPTLHEAFCSVIIEGMALERPVIATDVAAAPEQIDHRETGLLVPPRDPCAIAAAVLELMGNPERAAALGREARRRVVERLNFPNIIKHYEQIYYNISLICKDIV
jgi:glycosyltransferase involved in cell wall biosynthesis